MGAASTADIIARAEVRAGSDPDFVAVLAAIVDSPTTASGELSTVAARRLNQQRSNDAVERFRSAALTTAQVQQLLGFGTPQAVHRLRSRHKLIGHQLGNATWFPAWQFRGGELRPDLPAILGLLDQFTHDTIAADRVMRLERDDLSGRSIAETLESNSSAEVAWAILTELSA